MTPDDRRLFEALYCAALRGYYASGKTGLFDRECLVAGCKRDVAAIRAAEGEEATPEPPVRLCAACKHVTRGLDQYPCVQCSAETGSKMWEPRDTQSVRTVVGGDGKARDLTAEDTIRALTQKLDEAKLAVVMHETLQVELVRQLEKALADLDQSADILHALCDERAMKRRLHMRTLSDYFRATKRADTAECALRKVREAAAEPKPARKVLPVGHVPERLEVGMVVTESGAPNKHHNIHRVSQGKAFTSFPVSYAEWFWADRTIPEARAITLTLAAPFEVPND